MIESIKTEEGYEGMPYKDSLGYWTIGYGTKLPITKEEAELILIHRLEKYKKEVNEKLGYLNIPPDKMDILYEMAYQMGVGGLMKFKHMIKALEANDYKEASNQMLDSRWARQTPNRAIRLAERMRK